MCFLIDQPLANQMPECASNRDTCLDEPKWLLERPRLLFVIL